MGGRPGRVTLRTFEWREEEDFRLLRSAMSTEEAEALHASYPDYFEVEFPSPINGQRYRFRSCGYVGVFPVGDDLLIRVAPKVPVDSLFRMLEYAYDLQSFRLHAGMTDSAAVDDLFETLAMLLARRVLDRARRGLHRDYLERQDDLPYVRGRLLFRETLRQSLAGAPRLVCEFDHHTPELEDNHILAWTLDLMGHMPIRRDDVRHAVRDAARTLRMTVDLTRVSADACIRRFYHRQNHDYEPMHGLCRFFLEQCGPRLAHGDHRLMPFSLHMPSLFESFVARWLGENLGRRFAAERQYHARLDDTGQLFFRIDLVIRERETGNTVAVLDTKYKDPTRLRQEDIQQIVAYAARMRTTRAILVYPSPPSRGPFLVGDVVVTPLYVDLSQQVDASGQSFLDALGQSVGIAGAHVG